MGRTDGGHLFAKKPPDRERGRREEGEKTLVQWHEFRYDYRCKAGCCCSGTCSCAAGSASDSEEFTCKGCPASAQNDCPTPSSLNAAKKGRKEGRKGREHNAPSFSASTFHHSFRGLRVTNVGSVDTLYSPNLEEEGENGRSHDGREGGRFNLASRYPDDDDRRRLHHTRARAERDEILKCVTVAAAAAVEVW